MGGLFHLLLNSLIMQTIKSINSLLENYLEEENKNKEKFFLRSERELKKLGTLRFEEGYALTKNEGKYGEDDYEIIGINDGQLEISWLKDESKSSFLQDLNWLEPQELVYFLYYLSELIDRD